MIGVILAGGKGERLKPLTNNTSKPMLHIGDRPFLEILLTHLNDNHFRKIIFVLSHNNQDIRDYFQYNFLNIEISYIYEEEPLGTGGAISLAISKLDLTHDIFVFNGDCISTIDYISMYKFHCQKQSNLTISATCIPYNTRFGVIKHDDNDQITSFHEKGYGYFNAWINTGIYVINPAIFLNLLPYNIPHKYSFEYDFMPYYIENFSAFIYKFQGYFIDIGTPKDYDIANKEIPEFFPITTKTALTI